KCPANHPTEFRKTTVPGSLLFDENNYSLKGRKRKEPMLSVAQRVGMEPQVTATQVVRQERDLGSTVQELISIAPGAADPFVRYTRHQRRAPPDDNVDNPDVASARELQGRDCVWAQTDENLRVEQAGTPQISNRSLLLPDHPACTTLESISDE
ncbi:unnamed protein product, partial [Sphacelaria rigidula]